MFAYKFFKILLVSMLLTLLNACSDKHQSVLLKVEPHQSTADVLCNYQYNQYNSSKSVEANSVAYWSCDSNSRDLDANGIPDHQVGKFPNAHNPYTIFQQSVIESFPLHPVETKVATRLSGEHAMIGVTLNGVKISGGIGGSCDDLGKKCSATDYRGNWSIETIGQSAFNFGIDKNNAHVQPNGTYHYHGMPEGFIASRGGDSDRMTLIGWAADGFPIYARYGYSNPADSSSAIKLMRGSYQLVSDISDKRPPLDIYPLGTFKQDWEYVPGSGDLDECNGQIGVTPEFPEGIYHYYATDSYPYFQRCVKGKI
ncbi:YHYH protein [Psychromonas sp. GE-S-Ul-11]|uniref:YHYH protein n=1 Tax=Psychromonas sp. GE-S-Ul-11 TaxID=3241170 RepID=UPI00390CCF9C